MTNERLSEEIDLAIKRLASAAFQHGMRTQVRNDRVQLGDSRDEANRPRDEAMGVERNASDNLRTLIATAIEQARAGTAVNEESKFLCAAQVGWDEGPIRCDRMAIVGSDFCRIHSPATTTAALREAAQAFLDRVQECIESCSYQSMVNLATLHGWVHDGPTWVLQRDRLRQALAAKP